MNLKPNTNEFNSLTDSVIIILQLILNHGIQLFVTHFVYVHCI